MRLCVGSTRLSGRAGSWKFNAVPCILREPIGSNNRPTLIVGGFRRDHSMNNFRYRVVGIVLIAALVAAGSTAVADEGPESDELDEIGGADVDELRAEELGDDGEDNAEDAEAEVDSDDEELRAEHDGDADEEADSEEADSSEEDSDGEADSSEEAVDEDWENPLRNRISPVLNREGSMGFHGIASALSPGEMNFQVGLLGQATGGQSFLRQNDEHASWTGTVLVNASFHEYFGAHLGIQARNNVNTYGRPQAMLSQGDLNLGLTGRYPVYDGISVGGDLSFYVPSSFGGVGFEVPSASVRPRALASFDIDEIAGAQDETYIPVIAHANIGYRIDNSENMLASGAEINRIERYAYGVSAYDLVEFGVGAEFPLPYVTPFLGWTLGVPVNADVGVCADERALDCVSDIGGAAFPQRLSLGAKGEPVDNLGLHLGMDIGLTGEQAEGLPATVPYEFHFGVSWNIDSTASAEPRLEEVEVEPERGVLHAVAINEESGEPVEGARIRYADLDVNEQLTASESGRLQSYEFSPGQQLVLEFTHPDYETASVEWDVEAGTAEREVMLEPLPEGARLTGVVRDSDEQPMESVRILVRSDSGEIVEAETDADGGFDVETDDGAVTVAAVADGYLAVGEYLEVAAGEESEFEFVLQTAEERLAALDDDQIDVDGDFEFESGEATLHDGLDELLDHLAAAILENPELGRIDIQGHTDDDGDEEELLMLSQERAESVRDALIDRGISPERLDAEGYGANQPVLPNTSSRNRAMNRRIEFHVVE